MAYYKKEPTAFTLNGGKPSKKEGEWNKKPVKMETEEEIETTNDETEETEEVE